jgi:hypothetical protein
MHLGAFFHCTVYYTVYQHVQVLVRINAKREETQAAILAVLANKEDKALDAPTAKNHIHGVVQSYQCPKRQQLF